MYFDGREQVGKKEKQAVEGARPGCEIPGFDENLDDQQDEYFKRATGKMGDDVGGAVLRVAS